MLTFIYIGLPLLIYFKRIDFTYKFHVLTVSGILVYILLRIGGFTAVDLGITLDGAKASLWSVFPVTMLFCGFCLHLWASGRARMIPNEKWPFYIFYIFISSPLQEFLYRGALTAVFTRLGLPLTIVALLTAALYSFVHIIYRDKLTLLLTFVMGVIWFYCYQSSGSLLGVSISHAVLGVVTIATGIID